MAIGIGLAILASLCFASGNLIEKWAVDRIPPFSHRHIAEALRSLLRSKWWLLGAVISVIGLLVQILAYSKIAITVVQAVGVAGIVLLVVFARVTLGERLKRRELFGLGCAAFSLVLVALSLTKESDAAGLHGRMGVLLLVTVLTLLVVLVVLATPASRNDKTGFVFGCTAGLLYGLSGVGAKGISTLVAINGWPGWIPQSLASPYLYLFLGCWALGLCVFQVGIQRSRVGIVASLNSAVASAFVVAAGMIIFGEHLPAEPVLRLLRLVGFAGILVGSALVGWGNADTSLPVEAALAVGKPDNARHLLTNRAPSPRPDHEGSA
jgi:drug/metabolite transporter (DMT)-like permease